MKSSRMFWFLTIIVVSFTFHGHSDAKDEKKQRPSVVVVGTVYCDTCFQEDFSKASHFISGALVAVECGPSSKPSFHGEAKTNEHGEFKVSLPFSVTKHIKKIKECSVKLIRSNEPYCSVASTATPSSSLRLKSRNKQGIHIFSAGFFTFKPLKQPALCSQKPSLQNSMEWIHSKKSSIPSLYDSTLSLPIQNPAVPFLPPLPELPKLPPLPQLPLLPPPEGMVTQQFFRRIPEAVRIPALTVPPNPFQPPQILPPNPFQPPPSSILPPNPFQPPPSILPPNPFEPPPSVFEDLQPSPPLINFPPIPGLTPPPPPTFLIHLPPFPFPPSPGFPGIPPASSSSSKKISP